MSTKAFQARVICDEETRSKLWRLTETFNDRVRFVLLKMLDMRAGRAGPGLKVVFGAIGSSQNAIAKMEAIGGREWKTRKLDSDDGKAFARIRSELEGVIDRIGGWVDSHPMEWRQHFLSDPSLLRWRRTDAGFADLTAEDQTRIEKKKNATAGRKKPKATLAGKKHADWCTVASSLLMRRNDELRALHSTRREFLWAETAQAVRTESNRLFDKERDLPRLANEFKRKVYESAFAVIDSHQEKLKDWRKRHADWVRDKKRFEKDHRLYMVVRERFDQFERRVGGATGKRRQRWHHYLGFLRGNPDLAGWRGGAAVVNPIPQEGLRRIAKARRNKRSSIEAEEFFRVNPEIKALDEIHGRYEEEYVRRGAARRFLDGFAHPPTLTLPHLRLHPSWYTFKRDDSYRELCWTKRGRMAEGAVRVMLPFDQDHHQYEWLTIRFRGTPRLLAVQRASKDRVVTEGKGRSAKKFTWRYFDPHTPEADGRAAEVKGIKLMFRPAKPTGTPYLVFTVALADKALSPKAQAFNESSRNVPEGMVSCAADLAMRHPHLAAVSIAVAVKDEDGQLVPRIVRTGFIASADVELSGKHEGRLSRGPSLRHQASHKQELRSLRKGSRAVKGDTRNREFQRHVTNMGEDASRKTARKLVDFALTAWPQARADVLAVENLKALRANARRERGLNAGLINWRRGHTAKWAKLFAETDGILFREEKAYWTSQVCSRCLCLGRRYTPCRNEETGVVEPRFGTVEKLFACPTPGCQIDANADLNASVNLHNVMYGRFPQIKKAGEAILIGGERRTYNQVERDVLARLEREAKWLKQGGTRQDDALQEAAEDVF